MANNIESHLIEKRVFKPARAFAKKARIGSFEEYRRLYRESIKKPDKFWAREAKELVWQKQWTQVVDWKAPFAKWFVGGKLNVSENCLDRHLARRRRATRPRSSGKASRATSARSPTSNCIARSAVSRTC